MVTLSMIAGTIATQASIIATKIIVGLIVLLVGLKLVKFLVSRISKTVGFKKIELSLQSFLKSIMTISLNVLVIVTVAGIVGIPMASFITILGSVAVAVGLALQGSLSNIAGGIIIIMLKPFVIGDTVASGANKGVVTEIGMFYTHLKTEDGSTIIIPNSAMTNAPVITTKNEK